MNNELAKRLLEKGILRKDTEVDVLYDAIDLSGYHTTRVKGTYAVNATAEHNGSLAFDLVSIVDGSRRQALSEDICAIDGMDPERLGVIHDIRHDGSLRTPGKRRGRKPKNRAVVV